MGNHADPALSRLPTRFQSGELPKRAHAACSLGGQIKVAPRARGGPSGRGHRPGDRPASRGSLREVSEPDAVACVQSFRWGAGGKVQRPGSGWFTIRSWAEKSSTWEWPGQTDAAGETAGLRPGLQRVATGLGKEGCVATWVPGKSPGGGDRDEVDVAGCCGVSGAWRGSLVAAVTEFATRRGGGCKCGIGAEIR